MTDDRTEEKEAVARVRAEARAHDGIVWNTDELRKDFEVLGFGHGYCVVRRKEDGVRGSLYFDHMPRFYYDFKEG